MLSGKENSNNHPNCITFIIMFSIITGLIFGASAGSFYAGASNGEGDNTDLKQEPIVRSSRADLDVGSSEIEEITPADPKYYDDINVHDGGILYINDTEITIRDDVWIHNGGALNIKNSKVTLSEDNLNQGIFNVTGATTTISIIDSELTFEFGYVKINCKNVTISGSSLHAKNATGNSEDYPEGKNSEIYIKSQDALTIKDSDIKAEGDEGYPDGRGGHGKVILESASGISIFGKGPKGWGVIGEGGLGGMESSTRSTRGVRWGRMGGDGNITIIAKGSINIQDTTVKAIGGMGGDPLGQGGEAQFYLHTSSIDTNIARSVIGAQGGLDGNKQESNFAGRGKVKITSKNFLIDSKNYLETKTGVLSELHGSEIVISAKENCKFYNIKLFNVRNVENPITPLTEDTTIRMFYWLTVHVKNTEGAPLEDAYVYVYDKNDYEIGDDDTDAAGKAEFDIIEGRSITKTNPDGKNRLRVVASKYDEPSEESFYLLESTDLVITIKLLEILIMDVNGVKDPGEDMKVGCTVTIIGNVNPPEGGGAIDGITATVDNAPIVPGPEDTSNDNSWTQWKLTWNSLSVKDGKRSLVFTVTIGTALTDSVMLNLTVDQRSCNHAPAVTSVSSPKANASIKDTSSNVNTVISGQAQDEDFDSDLISVGNEVEYVSIVITDDDGEKVLNEQIPRLEGDVNYDETTGIWTWNFQWNTREMIDIEKNIYKYPNGNYTITVSAYDGELSAQSWGIKTVNVDLYHLNVPHANLNHVDGRNVDPRDEEIVIKTKSKMVEVELNANKSYDTDGLLDDLEFYWEFGDEENSGWVSSPKITHEYKVENNQLETTYKIKITVRDKDSLESVNTDDNHATIIIEYQPPEADRVGPLSSVFSIDFTSANVLYLFIILIIILNALGLSAILFNNHKISKQRKAQRAMMDKQRRELAAEIAKERADAGYGDYTETYAVTPAAAAPAVQPPAVEGAKQVEGTPQAPALPQAGAAATPAPSTPAPAAAPTAQAPPQQQAAQPPAAAPTAQAPQQQASQPPAAQPQVTTATVQTPGSTAAPQQVPVTQGTPQAPASVGQDVSTGMASYQVKQCPHCRATIHSGFSECPQCKGKL